MSKATPSQCCPDFVPSIPKFDFTHPQCLPNLVRIIRLYIFNFALDSHASPTVRSYSFASQIIHFPSLFLLASRDSAPSVTTFDSSRLSAIRIRPGYHFSPLTFGSATGHLFRHSLFALVSSTFDFRSSNHTLVGICIFRIRLLGGSSTYVPLSNDILSECVRFG